MFLAAGTPIAGRGQFDLSATVFERDDSCTVPLPNVPGRRPPRDADLAGRPRRSRGAGAVGIDQHGQWKNR